jgi:predicted dehydrogenase
MPRKDKSPVRIGFVGVGQMGQAAHLRNYAILPDCEVVALAELRPQLARRVAERYGVPRVYESDEAMLRQEQLDGIVAAQPFTHHGQLIPGLYKANIPIMTEKPLAASLPVGEQMLKALAESGARHMLGYHKRSEPAVMWAKAEMDRLQTTGELGALRYVRLLMPAGNWRVGCFDDLITSEETVPSTAADAVDLAMSDDVYREYVGFVNYYVHQVNLMRHLLGEPYDVTYADSSGVLLAVQSKSGVCGAIEMTPYSTTLDWQESVLIAFEHGTLKIEIPAPLALNRAGRVEAFYDFPGGAGPKTVIPQLEPIHAMRQQAANFVRAIRGEAHPLCEAAEALEDLEVARAYIALRFPEKDRTVHPAKPI